MRKLTAEDYLVMPWKNGGGTTTQLAISPAQADLDNFAWRISTAQVASNGPFSAFPGVDRSLAVLSGQGMILSDGDGERCRMDAGAPPFVFRGEQRVFASLEGGPVVDFNVMTRRAACTHTLEVLELQGTHRYARRAGLMLVYLARGDRLACQNAQGDVEVCGEGESILLGAQDDAEVELASLTPLVLCIAHISSKEAQND